MYHVPTAGSQEKRLKRLPRRGCCTGMLTGIGAAHVYAMIISFLFMIINGIPAIIYSVLLVVMSLRLYN